MKTSQLKEAIKNEIKSVLSEDLYGRGMTPEMADTVDALIQMLTPADTIESLLDNLTDDLNELPDEVDMDFFLNSIDAIEKEMYRNTRSIRFVKEGTWSSGTYNEIGRFIQDIKNLKDKYYNIVGNDDVFDGLDRAEESAREMMIDAPENRSDLNEDEMSDEEKDKAASKEAKKKDSIATISNKLQKLTAKMKKKAKEFKEAEGKAKDKIKDELKDMTAEKKKLEKAL